MFWTLEIPFKTGFTYYNIVTQKFEPDKSPRWLTAILKIGGGVNFRKFHGNFCSLIILVVLFGELNLLSNGYPQ
jgi:hypothetical protein